MTAKALENLEQNDKQTSAGVQRIVVVSNRLPFTVMEKAGELVFAHSVGGVATGLRSCLTKLQHSQREYLWVGWPGSTIADSLQSTLKDRAMAEHRAYPVFLTEEDIENFYQGFCNKTIWPLFHYFPNFASYTQDYYQHYVRVTQSFSDTLQEILRPDDLVWVHDYHLMLLPRLLRERFPTTGIGFFLHIPFPDYEIFRLLPGRWRKEILEGLLGADLIGFHTYDYMQYFVRCVLRILGRETSVGRIFLEDRLVRVDTFPMGIDFKNFHEAARSPEVLKEKEEIRKFLGDSKVVLSVDRLDYSKGIIKRLEGLEHMLEANPEWHGRVTTILVVVPSRIGLEHYELMKRQIEEQVGKINGKFGRIGWTPVVYQYRALTFEPLVAMYALSDVALITPLRDGMNLIAKEYVASRPEKTGVLILSEMAGAAKELGEAIIINPNNHEEIADALREALNMELEEQIRRNQVMQDRLRRYDVVRWAEDFLAALILAREANKNYLAKSLGPRAFDQLFKDYYGGARRLLLLDYDGTLVGFVKQPHLAKPSEEVLRLLDRLGNDPSNHVVLISGRTKDNLDEWFGALPIGLVAEHGAWLKSGREEWRMLRSMAHDWKPKIRPLLEMYTDRVPGSLVEEKDYSLVWHYRAADERQGKVAAQELTDDLLSFIANIDVQVLRGSKIVEVRTSGVNKGMAAMEWVSKGIYDFIFAVGDDWTDEDLFPILPDSAYSIRVGFSSTHARYSIANPREVVRLLARLVERRSGYQDSR
jgi:trehalose 6-phosphate synthase/phosphatase